MPSFGLHPGYAAAPRAEGLAEPASYPEDVGSGRSDAGRARTGRHQSAR